MHYCYGCGRLVALRHFLRRSQVPMVEPPYPFPNDADRGKVEESGLTKEPVIDDHPIQ